MSYDKHLMSIGSRGELNPVQAKDLEDQLKMSGTQYVREDNSSHGGTMIRLLSSGEIAQQNQAAIDAKVKSDSDQLAIDTQDFYDKQKGEGEAFVGKFKEEYPTILSGIESDLGLPGLRSATQTGMQNLEAIPESYTQASAGKDVSARQLERMIASGESDLYPDLQKMISGQQWAEGEFGRRAEQELAPWDVEFQTLADGWAREATGFNINLEGQLNILLTQLQQTGNLSIAQMNQATSLATLEGQKDQLLMSINAGQYSHAPTSPSYDTLNLGDKYQVLKDGDPYGSYNIGLGPKSGSGSGVSTFNPGGI